VQRILDTLTKQFADPVSAGNPLWFKDAVIYETHIKTFADSDGDGVGDFRGSLASWITCAIWG